MRVYEVEVKRVSYLIVTVEAASADEAGEKAIDEGSQAYPGSASWEVEAVEDITGQGDDL